MRYKYISLTLLAALVAANKIDAQAIRSVPKLVVNITIDQFNTNFLEAFAPLYGEDGFKKVLEKGMVYSNASYPFSSIDRASAIAAISTGTTPYYNSIIGSRWLSRESLRPMFCVDDDKFIGFSTLENSSPRQLKTSTIGDELKISSNGKSQVYSVAPFREAAILSAGHAADGAIWIDDNDGYWCSTSYYSDSEPSWLNAYNRLNVTTFDELEWKPTTLYSGELSKVTGRDLHDPFKHTFKGEKRFYEYKQSGLVNENVTRTALQCIVSNALGIDGQTDLLNITYYAGYYDNKTLSECQMELLDTYLRLDKELSKLIGTIEQRIGSENVLFFITSTGYCNEGNTDYSKYKIPSGVFNISRNGNLLNMYFGALWGQGRYVETTFDSQIYLNHKLLEQKRISLGDATKRAQEFLTQLSGVSNVYTSLQLKSNNNQNIYKIRNSFHPERNGDIIIEIAPGWKLVNEEYQDNNQQKISYTRFPIIIYGANYEAAQISTPVTTDRIAPSIAKAIRIRAPNACTSEPLF
ncbi:MAG: alkaline phosphatase family protein [Prevotella sp.]|nr:alkaline phosphatase family protein [Prevotella sp.]